MFLRCLFLFFLSALLLDCSGSSALPQSSIPAPSLTVGGTVSSPTSTAFNTSALIKTLDASSATGVTCNLYTLEGELLATVVTDNSGNYSASISIDDLKGSDDSGTTWSEEIVLDCENGIQLLADVTVDEDSTTTLDLGTADTNTALIAIQWVSQFSDFTGWGVDYSSQRPESQLDCFLAAGRSLYENADADSSLLFDDVAVIKQIIDGLIASGITPDQFDYASWPLLMAAFLDGNLQTDVLENMISIAKLADASIDENSYFASYNSSTQLIQSIDTLLFENFNNNSNEQAVSICNEVTSDSAQADALMKPLLSLEDYSSFQTTFSAGDGFDFHLSLLTECLANSSCDAIDSSAGAYAGFISSYGGDLSSLKTGDAFNSDAINGVLLVAQQCAGSSAENNYFCGVAMNGIIDAYSGLDGFKTGGSLDADKFSSWSNYWEVQIEGGLEPVANDPDYYDSVKDQAGAAIDNPNNPVNSCLDSASALADKQDCLDGVPFCGDTICDDFENSSGVCALDCGGEAPPPNDPNPDLNDFSGFYIRNPNIAQSCFDLNVINFQSTSNANEWQLSWQTSSGAPIHMLFQNLGAGLCVAIVGDNDCACSYEVVDMQRKITMQCNAGVIAAGAECSLDLRKNL